MPQVWIALGANLGDREATLHAAFIRLEKLLSKFQASSLHASEPMYYEDQPPFLNAVAMGETQLGPWPLLCQLKAIERELGRTQTFRNGPRVLDLDLLAYGVLQYRFIAEGEVKLEIPHPRMHERSFVMEPLREILPDAVIPGRSSLISESQ